MNYHLIKYDDMNNGEGLRITLFVSSCEHRCKNCHNPQTWDAKSGKLFDSFALNEIYSQLSKDYISGLTLSGGDPLNKTNLKDIYSLCCSIKEHFPNKTIWLYTGYTYEEILQDENKLKILKLCDVLVDGKYVEELSDVNYKWAGSLNQKVVNIQKSLSEGRVIELE